MMGGESNIESGAVCSGSFVGMNAWCWRRRSSCKLGSGGGEGGMFAGTLTLPRDRDRKCVDLRGGVVSCWKLHQICRLGKRRESSSTHICKRSHWTGGKNYFAMLGRSSSLLMIHTFAGEMLYASLRCAKGRRARHQS